MSKVTASKVAMEVDTTTRTLLTWYKWYFINKVSGTLPEGTPELPEYEQAYKGAPRFWESSDVEKIKVFKAWLPKGRGGVMGEVNASNWGDRGRRALANKRLNKSK